ncbi:psiQ, partial [Symbiodinium pilosum]
VMWLSVLTCQVVAMHANDAHAQQQDLDVNYVAEMLDKLQVFVKKQSYVTHEHFNSELKRLRGKVATMGESADLKLLQDTVKSTEMERMEAEAASLEAMQYYHTVRAASGSTGGAPSCDFLTCGHHAVCKSHQNGRAFCECVPCFSGDGFTCRPSKCTADTVYSPQLIVPYSASGTKPDPIIARDVSLSLIGRDGLLVAIRDEQRGNQGFLTVGRVKSNEIMWGDWQLFSLESKAFEPTVVGLNDRLLIAYRDAEENGVGYLVSGQLDSTDLTGFKVRIGQPYLLHHKMQQRVSLVALSASRAVCLHAAVDEKAAGGHYAVTCYDKTPGKAFLVQVHADGLSLLGKYHFGGEAPISHIAATKLSEELKRRDVNEEVNDGFAGAVGYLDESLRVWDDDLLIVSPHQFALEPEHPDMYHRDVALVSQNLFAYSYYSGAERKTKLSLVHVDPGSHQMAAVGDPVVLSTGYNSIVGAVSLPAGSETPSTFTYFLQPTGAKSAAKVCGVSSEGRISGCKDVTWAEEELESATGIKLPDGRLLFAFIQKGSVQTRFVSAEEASAQDVCAGLIEFFSNMAEGPLLVEQSARRQPDVEIVWICHQSLMTLFLEAFAWKGHKTVYGCTGLILEEKGILEGIGFQVNVAVGNLPPEDLKDVVFESLAGTHALSRHIWQAIAVMGAGDFTADHPDFQSFDGHSTGLVEDQLGPDKKPVFKGGLQLSSKENFDQWFRDVPGVNRRINFRMDFEKTPSGTYVHDDASFFPIDGQGWNDTAIGLDDEAHNFYFTLEMHGTFVYIPGLSFTFRGDDDVWVYMNGKLVIDLGGVHNPMVGTYEIDNLNLTEGEAVDLSFFFAERRCCGSEFRLETTILPVKGTCTIWGDPHIDPFDNGIFGAEKAEALGVYSSGDYWLVKNSQIKIQARYGTTIFTPSNMSALLSLALSGDWLWNNTLIIEPEEGQITWNGEPILSELNTDFVQPIANLRYMPGEKHIDGVLKNYPVKLIQAYFTRNVEVTVNRWPKHIDAIIRMPQQLGGQDGHCGNFNFDVSDDTKDQIEQRIGPVAPGASLFAQEVEMVVQQEAKKIEDCDQQTRKAATKACKEARAAEGDDKPQDEKMRMKACVYDYCFGSKEFVAEDAIVEHESVEE